MRKVSGKKYLLAFALTLLIFGGGVVTGVFVENIRLGYSQELVLNEKVNLRSIQLQQNYIESGIADCNALNQLLETYITDLGKKMAEVINYDKNAVFNDFDLVLRDYFLTEIQFYLTAKEIEEQCSRDNVKVLYFYDESSFDTQGDILGYLKKLFKNKMLVFSFNSEFKEEPMINLLLNSYNITEFPSVVVEETVFSGHTKVRTLMKEICLQFVGTSGIPKECRIIRDKGAIPHP